MTPLSVRTAVLTALLALSCAALASPIAWAQESAATNATSEILEQLLPAPPEGFERTISPVPDGKNQAWAQATYLFSGEKAPDGGARRADADGTSPVAFEVEISGVTDEEKTQVLGRIENAPPGFTISTETYPGHDAYVITGEGKSYLYLFAHSFQVYMEGNASPTHLRTALGSIDVGTLAQYSTADAGE